MEAAMTISRGNCHFCSEPVDVNQTAAFPITGWEAERQGGGANRIIGRERTPGKIAHAQCAERAFRLERKGISSKQESLL
jgi:hypothetical protein